MIKVKKNKIMKKIKGFAQSKHGFVIFIAIFTLIGATILFISRAATPSFSIEPESTASNIQSPAIIIDDANASGGKAIAFGAEVTPPSGQPPSIVTGGAVWQNKFDENFDGSAVSTARWNVQNNSNYGGGNNEDQCYMAANTTVSGGTLKMVGKRQTVSCGSLNPDTGNNTYYFTSGMVTTRKQGGDLKYKYRHGYTEARVKLPLGNLYWGAYWLVGAGDGSSPSWPAYGEFDIFEQLGAWPDKVESNFHKTGGNIGARGHCVNNPPSSTCPLNIKPPNPLVAGGTNNWHTYGFNWTANKLQWFIDGVLVREHTATTTEELTALGYEHSIHMNLAMGGAGPAWHGYTGRECSDGASYCDGNLNADLPGTMEIDYVKVWQP